MRQLHVQDPWAGLAYRSEQEILNDLLSRIQVLENRLRHLEETVRELTQPVQERLPEVEEEIREAIPVRN